MAFQNLNNLINVVPLIETPYQGFSGIQSYIQTDNYQFIPVQDIHVYVDTTNTQISAITDPQIVIQPSDPTSRIVIPNVNNTTQNAVVFPPTPPVTPIGPTPPQGEDKFNFSDINYLLTNAINVLDPGLLQGVVMPNNLIWQAKTDQFKNDPVSVQGTAYLYPNTNQIALADRTITVDQTVNSSDLDNGKIARYNALSYAQIERKAARTTLGGPIEDYQSELPMYEQNAANNDIKTKNINRRLRIPNYGQFGIDRTDYLNDTGLNDPMIAKSYDESVNDFIKFRFKDARDPKNKRVQFRAFLTEFNDSDSIDHEAVSYIGQPDPGFIFTSITRTVNIGFVVAANTRSELTGMYNRLNELRSMVLPMFKSTAKYMIGGFTLFTLGDYFKDMPAIITNFSRDIKIDLYPWEINMRGEDLFEAPKLIDVRLSLNILNHETPTTTIKSFDML